MLVLVVMLNAGCWCLITFKSKWCLVTFKKTRQHFVNFALILAEKIDLGDRIDYIIDFFSCLLPPGGNCLYHQNL